MTEISRKIPFGLPIVGEPEKQAVMNVLGGSTFVHGPKVKEFEAAFSKFTSAPYSLAVASCTAALHLAYFYLGIKEGDEVIVPAQTHIATAHAVELCRGSCVFVDAEEQTGNIDIIQLESKITPRTRAISLVHYLGMPVDMDSVLKIARKHGLFVVEDCALSLGARYKGVYTGLYGDVGCFSFYPVKHMTTVEGGMLTTTDASIADKIGRQRAFGVDRTVNERTIPGDYDTPMLGFNYRMNEVEAAIGVEQLKRMPDFLEKRKSNYEALAKRLRDVDEIRLFQSSHGEFLSSYYCFSVVLGPRISEKRTDIINYLNANGVGTSIYYPRAVPMMKYYKDKYDLKEGHFPVAHNISTCSIALPVGPHIQDEDIAYIAEVFKTAITKALGIV
jgi:perosamine synthetase